MANKRLSISPRWYGYSPGSINMDYSGQEILVSGRTPGHPDVYFYIPIEDGIDTSWADLFKLTATYRTQQDSESSELALQCSIDDAVRSVVLRRDQVTNQSVDFIGIPGQTYHVYVHFHSDDETGAYVSAVYIELNIPYTVSSQIVPYDSPTSGTINISNDITFSAELQNTTSPPIPVELNILTATFYWRNGKIGEFNAVEMDVDGENTEVTIAGGTFLPGITQWYIEATDTENNTSQTDVYELSSQRKPVESTPISPNNVILDASDPVTFQWRYTSTDSTPQSKAQIQVGTDNATWTDLEPIIGEATSYTVDNLGGMIGTIYWRVLSYNQSMVASDWSAAISFIVHAAPTVQNLSITAKPWATVSWQSDDQLSYEVFVDDKSLGSFFGSERQYQLPDYLSDGNHTVGVRVLGSFSLWSQILETTVSISNSPATQLALKIMTDVDAELSWTGGSGDFYIYRDGLMIGHTDKHSFIDRTAVGSHDYLVVERLASGYYNASAVLTRTPSVDCQHIAALAGGEWVAIPHTLKSQSDPSYSESQDVEYNYLAGSDYPTASIGSQRNDSGAYSAVFLYTEQDEHKRFLALRGKPVIFKTPDGDVVIGILHAWERKPKLSRNRKYYTAYTFSIQRVGWGDFIDDTI